MNMQLCPRAKFLNSVKMIRQIMKDFFLMSMSVIKRNTGRKKNADSLRADRQYAWHGGQKDRSRGISSVTSSISNWLLRSHCKRPQSLQL